MLIAVYFVRLRPCIGASQDCFGTSTLLRRCGARERPRSRAGAAAQSDGTISIAAPMHRARRWDQTLCGERCRGAAAERAADEVKPGNHHRPACWFRNPGLKRERRWRKDFGRYARHGKSDPAGEAAPVVVIATASSHWSNTRPVGSANVFAPIWPQQVDTVSVFENTGEPFWFSLRV